MTDTIVKQLLGHGRSAPDALAFRFLGDPSEPPAELSYGQLIQKSERLASGLLAVAQPGDRALLLCSPGLESVVALYACFMAGLVAVPVAPPHPSRLAAQTARLVAMVRDCTPRLVLATSDHFEHRAAYAQASWELVSPRWVDISTPPEGAGGLSPGRAEDLAFLQYTSGSTTAPRGVRISHANIVANQELVGLVTRPTGQTELLSWLPFYHDMGLCFYFQGVHLGIGCTLMSPMSFVQQPLRWLEGLARCRSSGTAAPTFALDRVVEHLKLRPSTELDLSGMRALVVGAEPIRPRSIEGFARAVAPFGWRADSIFPCYGLAECTLMATCTRPGGPVVVPFDARALAEGEAGPPPDGDPAGVAELVANGAPGPGHRLIVADPEQGRPVPDGRVGEVWISGPSVGGGYWGSAAGEGGFDAQPMPPDGFRYLRTGDLGFLREGRLFITGRRKDLIIINGRNIYPDDVEEFVRGLDERLGEGVAAFEWPGAEGGVGLAVELRGRRIAEPEELAQRLQRLTAGRFEAPVAFVGLLPPLHLPRTSSGKIRRGATAAAALECALPLIAHWPGRATEEDGGADDGRPTADVA